MGNEWLMQPGETGSVRLVEREGSWLVAEPPTDGEVICIPRADFDLPKNETEVTVEISVGKYIRSSGDANDYVFAESHDASAGGPSSQTDSSARQETVRSDASTQASQCSLTGLSGSGDYVTVEAIVDEIFWVKKEEPKMPDIAGALCDEESNTRQMFVVNDGVSHPYLEEGRKFVFQNAKDHYYEGGSKVQLMITQHTDFTDKGLSTGHSSSSDRDTPSVDSSTTTSNSGDKSLHEIAQSMLGGEEFTETQQRESSISKAKKKAKRQQRDPAIDPKFNKDR